MGTLELESIRDAIAKENAAWGARDNPLLRLPSEEQARRLGVLVNNEDLADLRRRVTPDFAELLATVAVGRPSVTTADLQALHHDLDRLLEFRRSIERLKYFGPLIPCWCWLKKVDWRDRCGVHAVTPIRDQGGCGSCVSFGTIATLESMVIIEHDITTDLSEAELLFCGGGGCGGWWPSSALSYIESKGVSHEGCFPYQDHDMPCQTCCRRDAEAIATRNHVALFDVDQRKDYLFWIGPMVGCFAVYEDFFGYDSGVYTHVTGGLAGYHCIELIGYDDTQSCWLCKNSWGPGWGDGGFFKIAYGQCELDTTFPFWGLTGTKWFK